MTKDSKTEELKILSEAIDGQGAEVPPALNQAREAIGQIRNLYSGLEPATMSPAAKERVVQFMNEAYEAEFGLATDPQKQAEGLFAALKNLSRANVPQVVEKWSKWASQQASALTEADFVSGLRIFRRIARECSLEDFCATILEGEVPPVALRPKEMEALCGGKNSEELRQEFLDMPPSIF